MILGVTKKLLKIDTGKDYIKCCHKLSKSDIIHINKRLSIIERQLPNFFVSKARSLDNIERYKATDLRQILL